MKVLPLLFALLVVPNSSFSKEVLRYDPVVVTLNGRLTLDTFPGPPNYTSVAEGDEARRYWTLNLDVSTTVLADRDDELFETHSQVRKIQLVCETDCRSLLRPQENQRVTLTGTLWSRHTAHHYTDVLMMVRKKVK